jgi:hypothetical protein
VGVDLLFELGAQAALDIFDDFVSVEALRADHERAFAADSRDAAMRS